MDATVIFTFPNGWAAPLTELQATSLVERLWERGPLTLADLAHELRETSPLRDVLQTRRLDD